MRLFFVTMLLLVSTACVPVWQQRPQSTQDMLWQSRHQQLQQLTDWEFKGRTLIRQGKEAWHAGITWSEKQGNYQIRLSGPFAQGGVLLEGNDRQVTLTLSSGEKLQAVSPEALLAESLGWSLPVSALRDWVRGMPDKRFDVTTMKLDEEGRLIDLAQADWQVRYLEYIPFKGHSMPAKIFMDHPELSVRIVISDWDQPQ